MKIFKIILAFLCFTLVHSSDAQSSGISENGGKIYEYKSRSKGNSTSFEEVIKVGEFYYAIAIKKTIDVDYSIFFNRILPRDRDFLIFKLDAKMNVKSISILPTIILNKEVESVTIKKFGEQLCAFYYFNNAKQFKQFLFAQKIDTKTLKSSSKIFKIAEAAITKKQKNFPVMFNIRMSPNNQQLLVTNDRTMVPRTRREKKAAKNQKNHTLSYWLYDLDFKIQNRGKDIKLGKGNTEFLDITFDDSANIALLGFEPNTKINKKSSKLDSEELMGSNNSLIMKIISSDNKEKTIRFAEGENFFSAKMIFNKNTNNIAVVALLSGQNYGANGIFVQQVNLSRGEILIENKYKFTPELVSRINKASKTAEKESKKNVSERKQRKEAKREKKQEKKNANKDYIDNLVRLGDCYYNDSNELIISAQKYYWYSVTTTTNDGRGNRTSTTTYYYVYLDVIGFKFDDDGELENFGIAPHSNTLVNYSIYKDYQTMYDNQDFYFYSNNMMGKIEMNDKASKLKSIKNLESFGRKRANNQILTVDNNELVLVSLKKKDIIFGNLFVKPK